MKAPRLLCCLILIGCATQTQTVAPTRNGLWMMQNLPSDAAARAEMTRQLQDDSKVSGACLNFARKSIEAEAGKPDFTLVGLSQPNDRMGSVEMVALNLLHAQGEYWELWHGDGLNPATSTTVTQT